MNPKKKYKKRIKQFLFIFHIVYGLLKP